MILKGGSRSGAIDLALHLSNEVDNEHVIIAEIKGAIAPNLYDAFREWQLISEATGCRKPFYSLSINPDPQQQSWTEEQWQIAIGRLEERIGLSSQPRAIIFHEKIGESDGQSRKHCHVVWSRITPDLKAVHMGNDRYKLKAISKELAKEFGLELRYNDKDNAYDLGASQGQNRDPETTQERKQIITEAWHQYTDSKQFDIALRQHGYIIAQGDRRAFVIIDPDNQIHSLARQIIGVKTKEVKIRLDGLENYPNVEQAKEEQRIRKQQGEQLIRDKKRADLTREQKQFTKLRRMAKRADTLHRQRRKALGRERNSFTIRHQSENHSLDLDYIKEKAEIKRGRDSKKPQGLIKHLRIMVGYETLLQWKYAHQDRQRQKEFEKQKKIFAELQKSEKARLERKATILKQRETRELYSLRKLAKKLGKSKNDLERLKEREQAKKKDQIITPSLTLT